MLTDLIPCLKSFHFPVDDESLGQVPATFYNIFHQFRHLINSSRSEPSNLSASPLFSFWFITGSGTILLIGSIACSFYSINNKKETVIIKSSSVKNTIREPAGFSTDSEGDEMIRSSLYDAFHEESITEAVSESDAKYAEDLQVQEALLASLLSSQTATSSTSSSSSMQGRPTLNSLLWNPEKAIPEQSKILCGICLENKETWEMYKNSTCSHSFCYDCTSQHITTKVKDNVKSITCPGYNCKVVLDFDQCRLMVTKEVLMQWDETLCKSMILESQKLYCPYRDCSALLVNDYQGVTSKIDCPLCKRSFCAMCLVPWHSEFTCQEFEKLNAKKKGKEDKMTEALAKKKNWMKCPKCKYFVERSEGCLHIICRCKYEFCYRCGSKWTSSHGGCKQKN